MYKNVFDYFELNNINREFRVIECGFNIGNDTILLSKYFNKGYIYGLDIELYNKEKYIILNNYSNLIFHNTTLSNYTGTTTLYLDNITNKLTSMLQPSTFYLNHIKSIKKILVPCNTINNFLLSNSIRNIDILWLNLEGFEYYIIENDSSFIKSLKYIYTEVNYQEFRSNIKLYNDIKKLLESYDFEEVYKISDDMNEYKDFTWKGHVLFKNKNIQEQKIQEKNEVKTITKLINNPQYVSQFASQQISITNLINTDSQKDIGYYINLEHRLDRQEHMINNILKHPFFKNFSRFNAVKDGRRGVGCTLSHINCLEGILKANNPNDYYIIVEDDINLDKKILDLFIKDFEVIKNENWDVILLGGSYITAIKKTSPPFTKFNKVIKSQTTVGYIVKYKYIQELVNNFKESMKLFLETNIYNKYAMDVHWHILQKKDNWYLYEKRFCDQIISYSDIEKKTLDYKRCYETISYI